MSFKITKAKNLNLRGAGDVVAVVAQPIARALDAVTSKLPKKLHTNVVGCGGCKRRQEFLNRLVKFS